MGQTVRVHNLAVGVHDPDGLILGALRSLAYYFANIRLAILTR